MTEQSIILPSNSGNGTGYRLTMMIPRRRFLAYLRERWWVILACLAATLGTVLVVETVRDETYNSYAQLLVGDLQVTMANVFVEDPLNYFGTQIELLKSSRLQGAAFDKLVSKPDPNEKDPVKLEVVRPMGTSILQLQASSSHAEIPQGFLQGLLEEYLSFKRETRSATSDELMISLTDQLGKFDKSLEAEQEKWADFQRTNNVAVLEEEAKSAGLFLTDLKLRAAKLKLDRQLLKQSLQPVATPFFPASNQFRVQDGNEMTSTNPASHASAPPASGSDSLLKNARLELALKTAERDQLQQERGEMAARRASEEVARLKDTVSIREAQNRSERDASLTELDRQMAVIEEAVPEWENKLLAANERLSIGQRLKNSVQREQGRRDQLLAMSQNVDLSRTVQQDRVTVLQAPTPSRPAKRSLPLWIALSIVAGLALGHGLVFVWHLVDDRFASVRDVKDQFGEPLLGLVPHVRILRSKPKLGLLQENDPRGRYFESFRHLRSALMLSSGRNQRPQVILITSVSPGEGKTTVAVNIACTLARSGMKVALVDADAKGSGMDRLLGKGGQTGMLDYLRGESEANEIIRPTEIPNLVRISFGTQQESQEPMLLHGRMEALLRYLKERNEFVIVDGPSVLESDDVSLLVPHMDSVVVVVRPFYTRARQLSQALGMLYQRRASQVNLVFNRARADDFGGKFPKNGRAAIAMKAKGAV